MPFAIIALERMRNLIVIYKKPGTLRYRAFLHTLVCSIDNVNL